MGFGWFWRFGKLKFLFWILWKKKWFQVKTEFLQILLFMKIYTKIIPKIKNLTTNYSNFQPKKIKISSNQTKSPQAVSTDLDEDLMNNPQFRTGDFQIPFGLRGRRGLGGLPWVFLVFLFGFFGLFSWFLSGLYCFYCSNNQKTKKLLHGQRWRRRRDDSAFRGDVNIF